MSNNDRGAQVAAAATGAAMAYFGFRKGGVIGKAVGVLGAGIAAARIAGAAGFSSAAGGRREVRQAVEVKATPEEAYRIWSRFEDFPRFMQNVLEVRRTAERTYHWTAEGPLSERVEWDAVVTADEPGRLISWRSKTAGVGNSGQVRFEPTASGARVIAVMAYDQPAGPIGKAVARFTGSDPESMVREDLRRFKRFIESGETAPVTAGAGGQSQLTTIHQQTHA